jgi:putative DNA primase/helicase
MGEKITAYLNEHGQASRSELTKDCFGGHASKDRIDRSLDELLTANPPVIVVETMPRPKGASGTPTKIYKPRANCAKSANCGAGTGFAADLDSLRTVRTVRTVGDLGAVDDLTNSNQPSQFATLRTVRNESKTAETRMDSHSSHSSHSSHTSHAYLENAVPADDVEVF